MQTEDYKRFYMHRTGHWLGLDVHDAGEYKIRRRMAAIAAGNDIDGGARDAMSVRRTTCPQHFWNIGVRIEDDVAVTESGCEVLTSAAPKTRGGD